MTSGLYTLSSASDIDTYGYLYEDHFNLLSPTENIMSEDDQGCRNDQFKLVDTLQSSVMYVLVVTTYYAETTGKFLIFASGPNNVNFKSISEYLYFVHNQHKKQAYCKYIQCLRIFFLFSEQQH